MKKILPLLIMSGGLFSFNVLASQMITQEEANHYKLEKIGEISVDTAGKQFSMPSDLQSEVAKEVDKKGGKYYVISSVQEQEGGLSGTVVVYK
ncbi:DUF1471 domain-containing protein [Enterobacter asburiae]|uniref:DUF1471 domain-containing protein n=1 Tax=Enterobacter asburiae TaxID=61645 RepID=UPI002148A79D|nr:DUF1471 domain-containing protein [Enterobacter asburiae]UUR73852.1 DUF1471 domain-containing protein [Enterobacter asburiae]